jgi:Acetyltransferase (GNAT) family
VVPAAVAAWPGASQIHLVATRSYPIWSTTVSHRSEKRERTDATVFFIPASPSAPCSRRQRPAGRGRPSWCGRLIRSKRNGLASCYAWLFAAPGVIPPGWNPDQAAERLAAVAEAEQCVVLIASVADSVIGFCTVYLDILSVRYGRRAWVEDLAVDPAHRSVGVGRGRYKRRWTGRMPMTPHTWNSTRP